MAVLKKFTRAVRESTVSPAESSNQDVRKSAASAVGNSAASLFGERAQKNTREILTKFNYRFNPVLIAAIVRREPNKIKYILDPVSQFHNDSNASPDSLRHSQYEALDDYYGKDLLSPTKLAIRICNSDNTETTQIPDATRFDVLHCLATHWDALVSDAEQKGLAIPDLEETLQYAKSFEDRTALYIFINGLSDEHKERAEEILNQTNTAAPGASIS